MTIRPGHLSDLVGVYEVCHQTGLAGQDASGAVGDRTLLGHYFAAPYLVRDPAWCWIAADAQGVAGYLVTTPDSRAFAEWMNSDWLPAVRALVPDREAPGTGAAPWSPFEAWIRRTIHSDQTVPSFVDDYPVHLHIDFLPRAQGQGLGSRLLAALGERVREAGLPGFHLGVGADNLKAQAFYAKQGLVEIERRPGVIFLGRSFR